MKTQWDDVPLSALVELYNTASPQMPSYHVIENRILSLGYVYPQNYLDLDEEDASEFILFLHSNIPQILSNFDSLRGDFEDYLMGVLKVQVKAFNKQKAIYFRSQQVLEQTAFKQEQLLSEPTFKGRSTKAKRLKFILRRSNTCRRRIFVFILSISPFMSMNSLNDLCDETNIDFLEVLDFREQLVKLCSQNIENLSHLKELRTTYFSQFMIHSSNSMHEEAERKLHFLDTKNNEIANMPKKASYKDIATVLGLSLGTVGNYLFLARNLLEWIANPNDPKFSASLLSIKEDMYDFIKTSGHSPAPSAERISGVYHPLEDFHVVKVDEPLIESPS